MTPTPNDIPVQLGTRIPATLLRAAKLHAVAHDEHLQTFVERALREQLRREASR